MDADEYNRTCDICQKLFPTRDEQRAHRQVCEIRLLDNEVAEKVLGWTFGEDGGNRSWFDKDGRPTHYHEHLCTNSFEPCKDMRQVYWIMEKLQEEEAMVFHLSTMKDGVYGAFVEVGYLSSPVMSFHETVEVSIPRERRKLPYAVCKALVEVRNRQDQYHREHEWRKDHGGAQKGSS